MRVRCAGRGGPITSKGPIASAAVGQSGKIGGVCGIAAALLFFGLLAGFSASPFIGGNPEQTLLNFPQTSAIAWAIAGTFAVETILILPFSVSLRETLDGGHGILSRVGATLLPIGTLLLAIVIIVFVGMIDGLSPRYETANAQDRETIVLVAGAIEAGLFSLFRLAQLVLAVAVIVLGFALRRNRMFPSWLGYLAIAAGVLAAPAVGPAGAIGLFLLAGFFVLFPVWLLLSGLFLWRSAVTPARA